MWSLLSYSRTLGTSRKVSHCTDSQYCSIFCHFLLGKNIFLTDILILDNFYLLYETEWNRMDYRYVNFFMHCFGFLLQETRSLLCKTMVFSRCDTRTGSAIWIKIHQKEKSDLYDCLNVKWQGEDDKQCAEKQTLVKLRKPVFRP